MSRLMKWATPVVAFAVLMFVAAVAVKAEDAKKETGTISGTVTSADGKPVAGAEVSVFHPMGKGKKAEPKAEKGDKPVSVVPSVKTDDKGEFTLSDVPAGDYTVVARLKGQGNGRENVTVKAGETAKVEIKLKAPKAATEKPKTEVAK